MPSPLSYTTFVLHSRLSTLKEIVSSLLEFVLSKEALAFYGSPSSSAAASSRSSCPEEFKRPTRRQP